MERIVLPEMSTQLSPAVPLVIYSPPLKSQTCSLGSRHSTGTPTQGGDDAQGRDAITPPAVAGRRCEYGRACHRSRACKGADARYAGAVLLPLQARNCGGDDR